MRLLLSRVDIDECSPNPCENGGNCTDGINDYSCTCQDGFTDKNCSTSTFYTSKDNIVISVELAFIILDFQIVLVRREQAF